MLTYCLKCKYDTESVNSKILKTKNGRTMSSSKCGAVCGSKKIKIYERTRSKKIIK